MPTKILMSLSALFLAVSGIGASFLPHEILAHIGHPSRGPGVLLVQTLGALYLGFAGINWLARANLIGGIYSRPVAVGNFMHFGVVAVVLLKALLAGQTAPEIVVATLVYCAFGLCFGFVLFGTPAAVARQPQQGR